MSSGRATWCSLWRSSGSGLKAQRDTFMKIDTKTKQAVVDHLYALNYPGMKPAKFIPDAGYEQVLHAELVFDCDHLIAIAERFWKLLWIVGRNRTEHPFYTSDEPVVRQHPVINETSGPVPPDVGLEFAFPLNDEFILVMLDRRMFSGFYRTSERRWTSGLKKWSGTTRCRW